MPDALTACLYRITLPPARAGEALRCGDPKLAEIWRALTAGEMGAVGIGPPGPEALAPENSKAPAMGGSGTVEHHRKPDASEPSQRDLPERGRGCEPEESGPEWPPRRPAHAPASRGCLLPGSFNPVHTGHRRMLEVASARLGTDAGGGAAYELAIANPDKPPLSPEDAAACLARFTDTETVWLTLAPTFPEKARIFPGTTFVVGVDTIVRIAAPRYYGGPQGRDAALDALRGCRFLVFGRHTGAAGFKTLDSVPLPGALLALCDGIPEADFRADISSTELRRRAHLRRAEDR